MTDHSGDHNGVMKGLSFIVEPFDILQQATAVMECLPGLCMAIRSVLITGFTAAALTS